MRILVLYYSLHGNTYKMARAVAEGARAVSGAEVELARIPDIAGAQMHEKNERVRNAQILQNEVPLVRVEELPAYRAVILGSPSRYGTLSAPVRHFFDHTSSLWSKGALEGRFTGVFTCSATPYGAADMALLSLIGPLMHLGMIVAGIPHSVNALFPARMAASPYGICSVSGINSDQAPTEAELQMGKLLGYRIADLSRTPLRTLPLETAGKGDAAFP